jgi:LuxR family transcriptional regulator
MNKRVSIAGLIADLHRQSPAGFAAGLHIRFAASRFLVQTYPVDWVREYTDRGLVLKDPTVRWSLEHTGALRWRDLHDEDGHGLFDGAARHGMRYGVALSVVEDGSRSIAGCARSDRDFLDVEIDTLAGLLRSLHRETAGLEEFSPADTAALRRMSVRLTRGPE